MYALFQNFLQEHGYSRAFVSEFERLCYGYHLDATLWDILGGDEYFLARAFNWTETKEGREFWAQVDHEWYSTCVKNQATTTK